MNSTQSFHNLLYKALQALKTWRFELILVLILAVAAGFRLAGLFWGEYQYLHPDERFLVWVGTDISPVQNLSEYFDAANSSLNPNNRGHGFYVYGTLPMFMARYLVEWIFGRSGFNEMTQVGRALSAFFDILAVFLVYQIARQLYNKRVGLLSAAFAAGVVLQIQQSHFFTMDTFANTFALLAIYCAVLVLQKIQKLEENQPEEDLTLLDDDSGTAAQPDPWWRPWLKDPLLLPSLAFGVALGMAAASKLNAAAVAVVLPVAVGIGLLRLPEEKRLPRAYKALVFLLLAAVTSLIVFRLLQPYAFSGPGFFGLKLNPQWVANIREQRAQSNGNVDYPPAMQWARRPVWFSLQNLVMWGLGLPLGLLAWAGFLWAGWRMLASGKRAASEQHKHLLIWLWTGFYFTWQSLALNPTMRYQLPIYPTLTIFAGWAVIELHDFLRERRINKKETEQRVHRWSRWSAWVLGGLVLLLTYTYAFAFSSIYLRPITRVEASRWIYQNIPGAITLSINTSEGEYNQPVPVPYGLTVSPGIPFTNTFVPKAGGELTKITLARVSDQQATHEPRDLTISIQQVPAATQPLVEKTIRQDFSVDEGELGKQVIIELDQPVQLDPTSAYSIRIEIAGEQPSVVLEGETEIQIQPGVGSASTEPVRISMGSSAATLTATATAQFDFTSPVDGFLTHLSLENIANQDGSVPSSLNLSLTMPDDMVAVVRSEISVSPDPDGTGYLLALKPSLPLYLGQAYVIDLSMIPQGGALEIKGAGIATEGDWDDNLPLRMDGYDGFSGIYPLDLTFNMYWDDNKEKLERFTRILDQAEYIVISSNRQWGTLPRIPERFPMTSVYYRELLGCPPGQTVSYCYNVAQPGTYQGRLGYELVQTFQSNPKIGPFSLNDQFAEEAFTVYDHPKVLIFRKTANYDADKVAATLGAVDFSQVIRIAPMLAGSYPLNLQLPNHLLEQQRAGGTWSEIFESLALFNRFPWLGAILWYLCISLLGWIAYPILRYILPGLADKGFPLMRSAGLLILAYLTWLAGSIGFTFSRSTINALIFVMALVSLFLAVKQREEILRDFRLNRKYILTIQMLTLFFFLAFLLVRLGNPDLWHPWKGGEKPMDFSYFNAVLKSSVFPPYDPWYAGGYLNYYYFGFVIAAVLVKWLGIIPSVAYNLLLPTFFSMIAMGAFSIAWNLVAANKVLEFEQGKLDLKKPLIPALAASAGMVLLGNLGTVRMIFQGYQRLVAPGGVIEGAPVFTRWGWAVQGLIKVIQGSKLPYGLGDWYWIPSRAIPAPGDVEPITEFPLFTVLYGDPHAHLMALPVTLLALSLFIGLILGKGIWKGRFAGTAWFLLAAVSVGALRPTNTWDFPPYLILGIIALAYTIAKYYQPKVNIQDDSGKLMARLKVRIAHLHPRAVHFLAFTGAALAFVIAAFALYQPYTNWYALGYTKIDLWKGTHTPLTSYLTHWGLFLFLITFWMGWETTTWLAKTPLSSLRSLKRYQVWIQIAAAALLSLIIGLSFLQVRIAWFVLLLAAWAAVLLFKPKLSDSKRMVLFLVGTGLVLTLMVEVIVLVGDIGRMNTVFKFYLQVWTFFAISAATALFWTLQALSKWSQNWRTTWITILALLVFGATLYPLMAVPAKIKDRMAPETPLALDGMAFMNYARYSDEWGSMDLSQDYRAIRWMQENVIGSPVIVEANLRNLYRWGSRFSIYTGLPGVVGWEWHQQQQRAVTPGTWVTNRILEIDDFYQTTDWEAARNFLRKYDVEYIVLGQQERGHYPGPGLKKFTSAEGILWTEVYRDQDTSIFRVIRN